MEGEERACYRFGQQRPRHCAGSVFQRGESHDVQRSPTLIVNVEPSAQLQYALYGEGPSLEDCDLITTSMPLPYLALQILAHELGLLPASPVLVRRSADRVKQTEIQAPISA